MLLEPAIEFAAVDGVTTVAAAKKPRQAAALTDTALQGLKPRDKAYKVTDGGGMYVMVSPAGGKSFRYDYRVNGNRETLANAGGPLPCATMLVNRSGCKPI